MRIVLEQGAAALEEVVHFAAAGGQRSGRRHPVPGLGEPHRARAKSFGHELGHHELGVVRLQGDLLDRPLAVEVRDDELFAVAELFDVERPDDVGNHAGVGNPLADELPLVVAAHALHDDAGDVERQRDHLLIRHLAVDELEVPLGPEKDVVDRFFGLLPHQPEEVAFGDRVDHDEDLSEEDLRLLLDLHRHLQLVLRDESVRHQEVAEVLPLVGGGGRRDAPLLEVDALLDAVPIDEQSAGLRAQGEPLKQLSQLHRLEVAGDSQRWCLELPILAQETETAGIRGAGGETSES